MTMTKLNCASINFGGINTSALEFTDFSNVEVKAFFQRLQTAFDMLKEGNWDVSSSTNLAQMSLREFIQKEFRISANDCANSSVLAFTNFMLDSASRFMADTMDIDFLLDMVQDQDAFVDDTGFSSTFDLGDVPLSTFVNHVLMKDKGIGGFDQISQGRPTSIGANLNQFLAPNEDSEWTFNKPAYLEEIKTYYTLTDGIPVGRIKSYRDIFLKGRKEGPDGKTARNYYTHNGEHPTAARNTTFHALANIVMLVYDLISMELICQNGPIPTSIPEKPSAAVVTASKAQIVVDLVLNTPDNAMDVIFLTECVPNAFETHVDRFRTHGYTVHYGQSNDGVCNAIIYRIFYKSKLIQLEEVEVSDTVYPFTDEFKEVPLHLSTKDGTLHLLSYHANGKGVTVNHSLKDTSFYYWLNALPGCVILGGDLNMDFKKVGSELSAAFELGSPTATGFSCFKQRTPLQAQYDKAGVFDQKYCDYIITRGCLRSGTQVVRTKEYQRDGKKITTLERLDCAEAKTLSKDELVVPNSRFPFEHYIVIDKVTLVFKGCEFFQNISSWLAWVDRIVNWVR